MQSKFAVMAWPRGGFAEMAVAVFETEREAQEQKKSLIARHERWNFRVAEVCSGDAARE